MGKLLALVNQSFCGCLIHAKQMSNTLFTNFFDKAKCKNI